MPVAALSWGKPRVHSVRKSNASSLGRAKAVAVPAGWWATQRFLQLTSSLPHGALEDLLYNSVLRVCWRQPIRPHIYASLESNVLEKHVQPPWCAAGCNAGVMGHRTRNQSEKEGQIPSKNATFLTLGIKSISMVQSTASSGAGVACSFLGSSSAGLGWEVPTNCYCLSEDEMDPLRTTDTWNPADTVGDDKAWRQLLAIPEAIYSHGRRTGSGFFYPTISWDTSDSLTADLLILLSQETLILYRNPLNICTTSHFNI